MGPESHRHFRVTLTRENGVTSSGVGAEGFDRHVETTTARYNGSRPSREVPAAAVRHALLQLAAHGNTDNDLLVTNCPILLGLRDEQILQTPNILQPQEATKIVGLLFRHRDHIALRHFLLDGRWGFYLALTKVRVPELNRYWRACAYSRPQRKDDLIQLGQTVNVRLHRALELRDEIGCQFYQRQNNYTLDYMTAFLDYWALMVNGAFDALARITIRVYSLNLTEKNAHLSDQNLGIHLERAGAREFAAVLSDPNTRAVLTLVRQLRNTVHGASYSPFTTGGADGVGSLVRVAAADQQLLLQAAQQLGDPAARGFTRRYGDLSFEPYSFAHSLTTDALRVIGSVAAATDVTRFFTAAIPREFTDPPARERDELFYPETLADIDLLG